MSHKQIITQKVPMLATIMVKVWVPHGLLRMGKVIAWVRMASAQLLLPTAYGDGLWGLQNTDITDAHGSIITDLLILFLMALWAYGS